MERLTRTILLVLLALLSLCWTGSQSFLINSTTDRSSLVVLSQHSVVTPTPSSSVFSSGGDPITQIQQEDPRCHNFSVGQPYRQEFYSPGYPGSYPAKIDCILVLKAGYGQVIRVDFRDQFDVEPHPQCLYDFLAVRDGAHGYSPLVNRYCGRSFPPVITSTENYLWLRFSSDDNIEYTGFRAVYQFLPDPRPTRPFIGACRFDISGLDGFFGRKDIPEEVVNYARDYNVPLDCTWVITVEEHQKIQLSFPAYALASPNECELNFIEVFGEKTDMPNRLRHFCGSAIEVVLSKSNVIHLRFFAQPTALRSTFDSLFTAVTLYRETEGAPKCIASEFDCEDAVCVDSSLRCNGRINCKFRYDEENCKVVQTKVLSSNHIIVILTIFCLTLFGLCFSCFYRCARKLKDDHRVYQTRRSRSREDRLDVFDETGPMPTSSSSNNKGTKAILKTAIITSGSTASLQPQRTGLVTTSSLAQLRNQSFVQQKRDAQSEDLDDGFQQRSTSRSLSSPFRVGCGASSQSNGFGADVLKMEAQLRRQHEQEQQHRAPTAMAESSGRDSDEDDEDDDEEEVEMVDHACQTRESLFDDDPTTKPSSSSRAMASSHRAFSNVQQQQQPQAAAYKAERTIDVSQRTRNQPVRTNSSSAASSKSGADVVVLQ